MADSCFSQRVVSGLRKGRAPDHALGAFRSFLRFGRSLLFTPGRHRSEQFPLQSLHRRGIPVVIHDKSKTQGFSGFRRHESGDRTNRGHRARLEAQRPVEGGEERFHIDIPLRSRSGESLEMRQGAGGDVVGPRQSRSIDHAPTRQVESTGFPVLAYRFGGGHPGLQGERLEKTFRLVIVRTLVNAANDLPQRRGLMDQQFLSNHRHDLAFHDQLTRADRRPAHGDVGGEEGLAQMMGREFFRIGHRPFYNHFLTGGSGPPQMHDHRPLPAVNNKTVARSRRTGERLVLPFHARNLGPDFSESDRFALDFRRKDRRRKTIVLQIQPRHRTAIAIPDVAPVPEIREARSGKKAPVADDPARHRGQTGLDQSLDPGLVITDREHWIAASHEEKISFGNAILIRFTHPEAGLETKLRSQHLQHCRRGEGLQRRGGDVRDVAPPFVNDLPGGVENTKSYRRAGETGIVRNRIEDRLESPEAGIGFGLRDREGLRKSGRCRMRIGIGKRGRHHHRGDRRRIGPREMKKQRDEKSERQRTNDNIFDHRREGSAASAFPHRKSGALFQHLYGDALEVKGAFLGIRLNRKATAVGLESSGLGRAGERGRLLVIQPVIDPHRHLLSLDAEA